MKILVIGGGGREHALVWKLSQSPRVKEILCAPGNAGIAGPARPVPVTAEDLPALLSLAKAEKVDLTVVGPEAPLCAGIVDLFTSEGLAIFGPSQAAAEIEGSKVFCKEFLARHNIPTANFSVFDDPDRAEAYISAHPGPKVVKADGLAAGKGVFVCAGAEEALTAVRTIMRHKAFGQAGAKIIVEERLRGEEASFIVLSDGKNVLPLPTSQDHKAVFDLDQGPNTGGMGAYSPAPVVGPRLAAEVMARIIRPTIDGLSAEGRLFKGFLYAGLMITSLGPQVLEFNCRLGDPEAQPILIRLKSDLLDLIQAALAGRLDRAEPVWDPRPAVCVVMASGGYPGDYRKGLEIKGLEEAGRLPDTKVFHAGTRLEGGRVLTAGGRVLGVTALGQDLESAIERAYQAVNLISWDGAHHRADIGQKALNRPAVGIVMGSDSDRPIMQVCADKLKALGVGFEMRIISAHRTPLEAASYSGQARDRGLRVLVAAAGGAAHLAGALAAQTILPVIGVPLAATSLNGLDALLSTVQMPPGVPVATVALDKWGAMNAAVLAAQIVALTDPDLAERLEKDKAALADKVRAADQSFRP